MFDNYTKIEAYLNGKMSEEDKELFEQAMDNDNELEAVVKNKEVYDSVADEILNQEISEIIKKNQAETSSHSKRNNLIAIAFSLVVSCFIYFVIKTKGSKGERIFAQVYSPPMGNVLRGENGNDSGMKKDCFLAHDKLDMGDIDSAFSLFKKGIKDSDILCKEKSYYYLGLISVKESKLDDAEIYLNKVMQSGASGYEGKAKKLLDLIK